MQSPRTSSSSLPDQDLELLSTYLDNALAPAERVNLERRLAAEPHLQAELAELRQLRSALRSLEPVAPPRSFTLDPARVGRPRPTFPLAWFGQLGSGLAGLLLVLLASVQLLQGGMAGGGPTSAPASAPAAQAPAADASVAATIAPAIPYGAEAAGAHESQAAVPTADPAAAKSAPMQAAEITAAPAAGAAGAAANSTAAQPTGDVGSAADSTLPYPNPASPLPESSARQAPAPVSGQEAFGLNLSPGLTLLLGLALIGIAVGWNAVTRRRA